MGTPMDPANAPGTSGTVNAKLRLMTSQMDDMKVLLLAILLGGSASGAASLSGAFQANQGASGSVPWLVKILDGDDVCEGLRTDAASIPGGSGTVSAKLRLITQQLDTLNYLVAITSGTSASVTIPNPIGVSGSVSVTQGTDPWIVSGNITTNVSIPNPIGVSGTINIGNTPNVRIADGDDIAEGSRLDLASTPGGSGTISAKLRLLTQQLDELKFLVAITSGTTVVIPNPIGVSGTISVVQSTIPWIVDSSAFVQPISGAVKLSENPTVLQGTTPWIVSGNITTNVSIPTPLEVSGVVSVHVLDLPNPIGVSGTFNTNVVIPQPLGVSGTVSTHVLDLPTPVGVSGSVSILGTVPVSFDQPIGVTGNFTTTVEIPQPLAVSGTVSTHILDLPNPIGVSGTVNIGTLPDINAHLPLPVGVSGTINVGNVPDVRVINTPLAVSGTVNTNIVIPNPIGVSGDINVHLPLPVGVSGSVDVLHLIGYISAGNSTTTPLTGDAVFTGVGEEIKDYSSISVFVYTDQDSATDGLAFEWSTDNINWDASTTLTVTASGAVFAPVNIKARYFRVVYTNGNADQIVFRLQTLYHTGPSPTEVSPLTTDLNDDSIAQTVRAVLAARKTNNSGYVNIKCDPGGNLLVVANQGSAGSSPWPVSFPGPIAVSGTVSIGNIPTVLVQGPIGVSGTVTADQGAPGATPWPVIVSAPLEVSGHVNAHLPLPVGVSGTVNIGNSILIQGPVGVSGNVTVTQGTVPWDVIARTPVGVSGLVSTNVLALPLPVGVSGSVSIIGTVPVSFPQPIAVSGNVTTTVDIPTPLGVSGVVSVHILDLPNPIGVSGTVNTSVVIPTPLEVSGVVSVHVLDLPNPIGVSGTVNTSVTIPTPLAVSGTVTVLQGTNPWVVSVANVAVVSVSGRVNIENTILASAARTSITSGADQLNYYYNRMLIVVSVTANTGAISVRPNLQIKDPISGGYATVWTAKSNITAQGIYTYMFGDGLSGGSFTETEPFGIPARTWRFVMVHNNGNSVTYSVADSEMF